MNVKETEMHKMNQKRQQGLQVLCYQNKLLMPKGVQGVLLNWTFTPAEQIQALVLICQQYSVCSKCLLNLP